MGTVTTRLQLALEDQLVRPYRTVPVDVRAGESLEVTLCYDRRAALVDLGCEGPAGWRGWSGGARDRFAITPHAATPGYVAGELEPGTWHVVLGLYRLPVEPLEVVVTATTGGSPAVEAEPAAPAPVAAVRGSARRLPSEPGLTWFAGDFHAHTVHSDGDHSIAGLARRAAANGLDVLAVTDHNTVSHHPLLAAAGAAYDITLLPGQEVTTDRGHANAFGDIGFVDFRRPAEEWVTQVAARGGLLSVNHPLEGDWAWQQPTSTLPPALELWHIGWFRDLAATAMWALWQRWRPDAVILGGSDFHNPSLGYEPGTPTTWVQAADRSPRAVLAALAAGRTAITRTPRSPVLLPVDGELVAVDAAGTVLRDVLGRGRPVTGVLRRFPRQGPGPYRLETAGRELVAVCP